MKSEEEVRKKLERLEKERKTEGPFTEQKISPERQRDKS